VGLSGIGAGNQSGRSASTSAARRWHQRTGTLDLGSQAVAVNAVGYNLAQASVTPTPVVSQPADRRHRQQALTVANLAPNSSFTRR